MSEPANVDQTLVWVWERLQLVPGPIPANPDTEHLEERMDQQQGADGRRVSRRVWKEIADSGFACRKCGGASQYWDVPVLCRDCRPRRKQRNDDGGGR